MPRVATTLALVFALAAAGCGASKPRADGNGEQCRRRGVDDCPTGTVCCAMRAETGNVRTAGQCVPATGCTEAP